MCHWSESFGKAAGLVLRDESRRTARESGDRSRMPGLFRLTGSFTAFRGGRRRL
jgi:hypothetical protein